MERLQKIMAQAGIGSRRRCEELILSKRVTVNGKVVSKLGSKADSEKDEIRVDGERVRVERKVYYLLYKPKDVVCTSSDERGRPRAVDLVGDTHHRLFTVGRLDEDSEGLLIVTNDGALTNVLTHPRYKVPKTYEAAVRGHMTDADLRKIEEGVWLSEGKTAPAKIRLRSKGLKSSVVEVTLFEGRNREIRRIFAKIGYPVLSLTRTRVGTLSIDGLRRGRFRPLAKAEIQFLLDRLGPPPAAKTASGVQRGPRRR
jgi:23S rRNA pseudouridine2605 synthase